MDIGLEPFDTLRAGSQGSGEPCAVRPDWHGLRARLLASRAAWLALRRQDASTGLLATASFDCESARLVSAYGYGLSVVNPVCSGTGKADSDIVAAVAGETSTGDRG